MSRKLSKAEYLKKKRANAESSARINQTPFEYSDIIKKLESKRIQKIEARERRIIEAKNKREREITKNMTPEELEKYRQAKKKYLKNQAKILGFMARAGLI